MPWGEQVNKVVSLALTAGLVLSGMTALGTPAAWAAAPTSAVSMFDGGQVTADNPLPETVSADALPTAQINGVVWQQLIVGNTVYAGGQFTSARPAGSPRGQNESPRGNILAYDIRTGALLPWAPMINGRVNDLEVSPDGSQLYVVGNFTEVDGQPRGRIAVFDLPSGALSTKVQPSASSVVQSVAATADTVYVGGYFGNLNNVYRPRVAAFSAANGATRTGFSVAVDDGMVQAIEVNSASTVWCSPATSPALAGRALLVTVSRCST
jgi:trimeric autotransporter adhesin